MVNVCYHSQPHPTNISFMSIPLAHNSAGDLDSTCVHRLFFQKPKLWGMRTRTCPWHNHHEAAANYKGCLDFKAFLALNLFIYIKNFNDSQHPSAHFNILNLENKN